MSEEVHDTDWIEEIRERLEAATEGPWRSRQQTHPEREHQLHWVEGSNGRRVCQVTGVGTRLGNTALIANAPTDIRRLLEVAEAARDLIDACEGPDLVDSRYDNCQLRHSLADALNQETTDE